MFCYDLGAMDEKMLDFSAYSFIVDLFYNETYTVHAFPYQGNKQSEISQRDQEKGFYQSAVSSDFGADNIISDTESDTC